MRIAVVAMFVSPYKGSERSVAWNYIKNMSKDHQLTIYYSKDEEDINSFDFKANDINANFICMHLDEELGSNYISHRYLKMKNWNKWHKIVKDKIDSEKENYDLVHYIGPIGFMVPGYLHEIDLPYIWGPISGVHVWPKFFLKIKKKEVYLEYFGRYMMYVYLLLNKSVRRAMKNSDTIISATPETQYQIKKFYNRDSIVLPENGINEMEVNQIIDKNNGLNIFFNGGSDYRKGLFILLDSLAKVKTDYILHVLGESDDNIKEYALQKNIKNIHWHGLVLREEAQSIMSICSLNVITSASEGNPTIIWESMSKGIPTLTLDHCGMSNVICDECGIKIPVKSYNEIIEDIANHIDDLNKNKSKIQMLSQGTLNCSKKFLWNNRIKILNDLYIKTIKIHKKNNS